MNISSEPESYATLLARAREAKGLSRRALGIVVHVDPSHLYKIETSRRPPPSRATVLAIARALDLSLVDTNAHLRAAGYALASDEGSATLEEEGTIPTRARSAKLPPPSRATESTVLAKDTIDERSDSPGTYSDAVIRSLSKTLGSLPDELVGPVIATVSSLNDVLETFAARWSDRDAGRARDDAGNAEPSIPGPISVGCVPIAGWQWAQDLPVEYVAGLIARAVDEAVRAGVGELVIVLPPERIPVVRRKLAARPVARRTILNFVGQSPPRGLGHAILQTRQVVGHRPFVVVLPDDRFYVPDGETVLEQLVDAFELSGGEISLLAVARLKSRQKHYGLARLIGAPDRGQIYAIEQLAEKPAGNHPIFEGDSAAVLQVIGRYILQPSIFDALAALDEERAPGDRLELTDALHWLIQHGRGRAYGYELTLEQVSAGKIVYLPMARDNPRRYVDSVSG